MPSQAHHRRSEHSAAANGGNASAPLTFAAAGTGLLILSAVSMAFEVILTHIFSVTLQYHYAFLAVSSAVLGLGFGAALHLLLKNAARPSERAWCSQTAAVVAVIIPLVVMAANLFGFVLGAVGQALVGMLPFLAVGLLTAHLYEVFPQRAAGLYAFDLGGAAFGLIAVLALLNAMSVASVGMVLGLLAALAAFLFNGRDFRNAVVPALALGLALVGLIFNGLTHRLDLPTLSAVAAPPDKTMFQMLADPAGQNHLVDSAWSSYARVDLVAGRDPDQMYAFTNGGAGSYMLRYSGSLEQVRWLTQQVEYLPFVNFSPKRVMILGAGAGKDVLQALLAGSQQITAVEVNPAMVALTRRHADYNGGILDAPGVTTVIADGRDAVNQSAEPYDMIYMNLVYAQAPAPGVNALSEAYVFTTQAFQTYWRHLAPHGRLAIVSHQGLEGSRALLTALAALDQEGIAPSEALKHAALMMYASDDPNQNTAVLILQKSPLLQDEIATLVTAGKSAGMTPLFLPGVYEMLFDGLTNGKISLDQFFTQKDYNLFPTNDESPFFFNLNPGLPEPLKVLLIVVAAALAVYLAGMFALSAKPTWGQMLFFGGLGVGYFLIEVPLIQRAIRLVGNPTEAMVIVLTALLLSGSLGSLLGARWKPEVAGRRIALAALLVSILGVALALGQSALFDAAAGLPFAARAAVAGGLLAPLGICLGIPFANGLRLVNANARTGLAYLWGWNAMTSVLGSALAASLAVLWSYSADMLLGAACYLVAAGAVLILNR
jgi:hypothetical protein